jgi:FMN phosphatase YigB (HAD superfamily)
LKYICFDIGNVICEVDFTNFLRELSKTLNLSMENVRYFLNRTQKLHDLGLTIIADELKDHFKIESPVIIENLLNEWNATVKVNSIMIDFLKDLIFPRKTILDNSPSEPIKVALLSNIGLEHAALMRDIITPNVFDNCIRFFSYEVGARKPSYIYYKTFLDMHSEFAGCIYLDDKIENIEAGNNFGFNSIEFDLNNFKTKLDLKNKLNEIINML